MKSDQRNLVTFLVIAAVILLGWPLLESRYFPTANPPVTKVVNGKSQVVPNPAADPAADGPVAGEMRKEALQASPRVRIDTPLLTGSINLRGARIDDLVLKTYRQTIAKDSKPIRLLSPSGSPNAYFASYGWTGAGAPGPDTVWQASGGVLAPGRPVTLQTRSATGQLYRIVIAVDDGYLFTVRQAVANGGTQPIRTAAYALVNRTGVSADKSTWQFHTGPMYVADGAAKYDASFANLDTAPVKFSTASGWLGFTDKYWLAAIIPDQKTNVAAQFRSVAATRYQADYTAPTQQLAPGATATWTGHFFAGAKEVKILDRYQNGLGIPRLENAIDWGWFQIVEKPIFYYLDWLFRMVGNFGVAIILLTLTIRLIVFPIAQRQYKSMAAMRALQPRMKALQDRYKDDKPRLQQEVMALYKTEKVNPLAGCLPSLIQAPILYALYKVLMVTIEMRHQPFALWIKDLSAPDPLTPVNLFGLLHFTPPHLIAIGIVPILLGISMWAQFKLNPAPTDEAQKQVFALLPWVLMVLMASYAVGLQIYWITSNIITIAQQRLLNAHYDRKTRVDVG